MLSKMDKEKSCPPDLRNHNDSDNPVIRIEGDQADSLLDPYTAKPTKEKK